jgi:hypothetical protein
MATMPRMVAALIAALIVVALPATATGAAQEAADHAQRPAGHEEAPPPLALAGHKGRLCDMEAAPGRR